MSSGTIYRTEKNIFKQKSKLGHPERTHYSRLFHKEYYQILKLSVKF